MLKQKYLGHPAFKIIKKHTKFCASCGKHFDMQNSNHKHFPFCEDCRVNIIREEFGTTEIVSPPTSANRNLTK